MQTVQLARNLDIYACNSSLLLGGWNRREDVNTLIDRGTDASVIQQIERLSTGCGSRRSIPDVPAHCGSTTGYPAESWTCACQPMPMNK